MTKFQLDVIKLVLTRLGDILFLDLFGHLLAFEGVSHITNSLSQFTYALIITVNLFKLDLSNLKSLYNHS